MFSSARGEQRVEKAMWRGETGRRLSQSLAQGWCQCRSGWWQWGWREWVDLKYVLNICPTCWKPSRAGGSVPATPRPTAPSPCRGHHETSLPRWPQPVKETEGNFESLDLADLAKKQPWWRKVFG